MRIAAYAVGLVALPAFAALLGMRQLKQRERPDLLPRIDPYAAANAPRPAIELSKPTVVVLLGADLTEITDALGPYEMFARAHRFNVVTAAPERQPTLLTGGLRILPHYTLAEIDSVLGGPAAVVVVPNIPNADEALNRPVIDWIRAQSAAGALIHSWCKGAMALAETGLLDGDTATAHWGDIPSLEKRYPSITWVRGVRWIEHDQFVMSAGITSGIDASLRVLIRTAGDSVARRVAAEMRYPNYHFAIDPRVEQYSLHPADLILPANAGYRTGRPRLGIAIYEGVGEMDLSTVYDAHVHTFVVDPETVGADSNLVVTTHGLTIYPSIASRSDQVAELARIVVPGTGARVRAGEVVGALSSAAPGVTVDYLHAGEPHRFGLEPVIEDLARVADVPTARFALKRMEFRSDAVRFEGSSVAWAPLLTAVALALAGFAFVFGLTRRSRSPA